MLLGNSQSYTHSPVKLLRYFKKNKNCISCVALHVNKNLAADDDDDDYDNDGDQSIKVFQRS